MDTLYLTDLDGTLLGADSRLSERSARALRRFYDEGIAVTVATGRSWTALDVLAGAPLRAPMVLLGGARVFDASRGTILREHVLSRDCLCAALEILRGAGLCPLLYTQDARDEQRIYYERGADAAVHAYVAGLRARGDDRPREVLRLEERLEEKAFYLTARGERAALEPLLPQIQRLGAHAYLFYGARTEGCFVEITPVSKRAGVEALRALTGARRIVAFGDNGNDEGLFAGAVGCFGNADSAFCGGKGFVACQEGKALGLIPEQHSAQVAVAQTDVSLLGYGAGDAERFQTDTDGLGGVGSCFGAFLDRDSAAQSVGPAGVFKSDGLYALDDFIGIKALALAELSCFLEAAQAILGEALLDFGHSSFLAFKHDVISHLVVLLIYGWSAIILLWGRCTWQHRRSGHTGLCCS